MISPDTSHCPTCKSKLKFLDCEFEESYDNIAYTIKECPNCHRLWKDYNDFRTPLIELKD